MELTHPELLRVLAERRRQAHRVSADEWAVRVELAACTGCWPTSA